MSLDRLIALPMVPLALQRLSDGSTDITPELAAHVLGAQSTLVPGLPVADQQTKTTARFHRTRHTSKPA